MSNVFKNADKVVMKVCLITAFPPSRGDLNEYGYHLARAIQTDARVELTIVSDRVDAVENFPEFKIERCWHFNSLLNPIYLVKAIRRIDPDVVWFNMGFATFAKKPGPAFFASSVPALLRVFGYYTHVTLHSLFEATDLRKAGVRYPALYRAAGRIATRLLLHGNDVTVLLPSYRSILVARYGADPERVQYRPHGVFNRPAVLDSASHLSDERIVLVFGYWGTYKRLELLLEAMKEVSAKIPHTVLVVAGTNHPSAPRYLESLQEQVCGSEQRVRFVGYVPEAELSEMFRSASVLVMPYITAAGSSGVMHQACEYGLPIIASDVPEIRELAREEGIAVAFYDVVDKSALAHQLIRLLESDPLSRSLREANMLAAERLPISQTVRDYLDHFRMRISKDQKSIRRVPENAISTMTNEPIQAAGRWLLESGIQYPNGGVARYYRTDCDQYAPISTEITGYTAGVLFQLHAYSSESCYLDAAAKAITFLVDTAWNKDIEAMPFECADGRVYSYFFDTGIITRALLAGFRKTQDKRLKDAARDCADSMARDFAHESVFSPVVELPSKKKLPYDNSRWSRVPGCYQLKAALAWYELWELTRDTRYLALYSDMLEWALSHEAFLLGRETEVAVMDRLHAYCYFLEGLLPVVAVQPRCADVMRSGILRVAHSIAQIGSRFLRSDVVAQLLRLRLLADEMGILKLDYEAAWQEFKLLEGFQCHDQSIRVRGAFWFGRKQGEILPFVNPVSTIFGIQALRMWDQRREQTNAEWGSLI